MNILIGSLLGLKGRSMMLLCDLISRNFYFVSKLADLEEESGPPTPNINPPLLVNVTPKYNNLIPFALSLFEDRSDFISFIRGPDWTPLCFVETCSRPPFDVTKDIVSSHD